MTLSELRSWCNRASFADDKEVEIITDVTCEEVNACIVVSSITAITVNKNAVFVSTTFKRYE